MRTFVTGATRDSEDGKLDFDGFLSPWALEAYAEYMHRHRVQPDGSLRASDNWQRGMPQESFMKSAWRHLFAWWKAHRGGGSQEELQDALCGLIFNAFGYLDGLRRPR